MIPVSVAGNSTTAAVEIAHTGTKQFTVAYMQVVDAEDMLIGTLMIENDDLIQE